MANRKPIPHINVPIMQANGSMELAWYLFLQWVSENAGTTDLSDYFTKEETQALLDAKANIDDLADVAFSGNYNDLSNKPTIGNATITINQGGTQKGTFTVNQGGDTVINLDAGSDIDNLTITKNADDELQAIGVVNKNTEVGATNPIYDWVGTEEEYEAQNIATLHPEWLCFITDDCENTDSIIVRREVAERNMGELVYSTIPITDAGLHPADGQMLDGAGIYADFYDYMVGVYNAGHTSIFCSEADWQTEVANSGVCGKYVLDTGNLTIRLPKLKNKLLSDNAVVGDGMTIGLTDGTTNLGLGNLTSTSRVRPLSDMYGVSVGTVTSSGSVGVNNASMGLTTDPAKSGIKVASSVDIYCYVVIANTVKTPVEVDIDNIATELNACYAHRVVEFQEPTVDNNYTWYRKYADGWVEQGGQLGITTSAGGTVTLPIQMSNAYYNVFVQTAFNGTQAVVYSNRTTTGFDYSGNVGKDSWYVCGMAAQGD